MDAFLRLSSQDHDLLDCRIEDLRDFGFDRGEPFEQAPLLVPPGAAYGLGARIAAQAPWDDTADRISAGAFIPPDAARTEVELQAAVQRVYVFAGRAAIV